MTFLINGQEETGKKKNYVDQITQLNKSPLHCYVNDKREKERKKKTSNK